METFSALLAICAGYSPASGEFPAQRPVTRSLDVFFDLRLNKRLRKHREAGDLRRYRAHYDVTVMMYTSDWNLVTSHGVKNYINISSGNGLLPGGSKPSPSPILIYHQSHTQRYVLF